jgi:2-hydroxyglutarate dehydrogenase
VCFISCGTWALIYSTVTSSRNSEVIHGGENLISCSRVMILTCTIGMYYPPDSMKARLCLRGRHMLYGYCANSNVPHRKTGKLVVTRAHQRAYIESLHNKAQQLKWPPHSPPHGGDAPVAPTFLISGGEAREMEPDLSKDIVAALWSPETGIVDSHALMESLHKDITDSDYGNAAVVLSTKVVRVDPYEGSRQTAGSSDVDAPEGGWVVQTVTGDSQESDAFLVRNLINTSGLSGNLVLNSLLPVKDRIAMYFARGSVSAVGPN